MRMKTHALARLALVLPEVRRKTRREKPSGEKGRNFIKRLGIRRVERRPHNNRSIILVHS